MLDIQQIKNIISLVIFLAIIIVLIVILKKFKNPRIETINLVDGCVGSGKTSSVICRVKRQLFRYYFPFRNFNIKHDYIILSSFPIGKIEKKTGLHYIKIWTKKIYCYDLTTDILILQQRPKQTEIIFVIDEFDSIISQFDYDDPSANPIKEYFKYCRHYGKGQSYYYLIVQSVQDVLCQVRRRAGYVYNMQDCKKIPLLPIVIYHYRKIMISDTISNMLDVKSATDESEMCKFIFFCNPFKWYDSFAYSERYKVVKEIEKLKYSVGLKRNDILTLKKGVPQYYATLKYDSITEEDYYNQYLKKKK